MNFSDLLDVLNTVVLQLGDRSITVLQILSLPTLIVVGYLLIRWGGRLISRRLESSAVNPDLVHLIRRVFYILARSSGSGGGAILCRR